MRRGVGDNRQREMGDNRVTVIDAIDGLYGSLPPDPAAPPIRPFVGRHFAEGTDDVLRMLVLGINCYYGDNPPGPGVQWFPAWMRERRFTFFARAFSEGAVVGEALEQSREFSGRRWPGLEGLYVTNMVRRYLPEPVGKRASDVPERFLDEGAEFWAAELALLADYAALPHAVIVFGGPIWSRAWRAFKRAVGPDGWAVSYEPCAESSDLRHHLNRVVVREGDNHRPLLLTRLDHPAALGDKRRAAWMVGHAEFRTSARLPPR